MKLPARLLLAALILSVGALSPIVPAEVSLPNSDTLNCCAIQNTGACHGCPATMGQTSSAFAPSCCATQATCLALYFSKATSFFTSMHLLGVIGVSDERATTRTQRPLIPPPRDVFS
jgi:hypothetical protein